MSEQSELEPRRVNAGRASAWIAQGWSQFKRAPVNWCLVLLGWMALYLLLSQLPGGSITGTLLQPLILGAVMLGAQAGSHEARGFRLQTLWTATSAGKLGPLLLLGVYSLLAQLLAALPLILAAYDLIASGALENPENLSPGSLLPLLVLALLLLPALMAIWFAPALVAVGDMKPLAAMLSSLQACWRNPLALLFHGLWITGLMLLVVLTYGLALFVAAPIMLASIYASYEDIYARRTPPQRRDTGVFEA